MISRSSFIGALMLCISLTVLTFTPAAAADSKTVGAPKPTQQSPWAVDEQTMLLFEMAVAALVVAFVLVFALGSRSNRMLAREIAAILEECLTLQFAQVGTAEGEKLVRDGQSYFWFYATGRRYTSGMMVLMDLAKRMDVFSYTSSFMSAPQKDRCVFYLPITMEVSMEPMTMLLVTKKELVKLKDINEGEAIKAVENLASQSMGVRGLPAEFIAMSEHQDIVTSLLPDSIRAVVLENSKYVNSIHVTESGAKWDSQSRISQRLIRVDFCLPMKRSLVPNVLEGMVKVAMHLVDAAAETKLTPAAKKSALEIRKRAAQELERAEQKKRAEEAAAKRLEKKKEEEEAVGKMSREKQMKYEEKKRKKEVNARMRKVVRK